VVTSHCLRSVRPYDEVGEPEAVAACGAPAEPESFLCAYHLRRQDCEDDEVYRRDEDWW
jgi:hypothetical protein